MAVLSRKRVLVAMSGGVDSSVTALLLKQQGYDVVGITFKLWDADRVYLSPEKKRGCCTLDDIHDARIVAHRLGIPHYVVDVRREFARTVIQNFTSEYLAGRTPNPCIMCNLTIKWDVLFRYAQVFSAYWVATGHHARIFQDERGRFHLLRGKDRQKDQSYVLWVLTQERLQRTLFPVGTMEKSQVRRIAREYGLEFLAQKPDSYEICFIPEGDYRAFLRQEVARNYRRDFISTGPLLSVDGELLGEHPGYPFFTIGQRRGLGIATGKRMYVVAILPRWNAVIVGPEEYLFFREMEVEKVHWISGTPPAVSSLERLSVQIRAHGEEIPVKKVVLRSRNRCRVVFAQPARAVTPGQSAVFYQGDEVLGGGVIRYGIPVHVPAWTRILAQVQKWKKSFRFSRSDLSVHLPAE